MTSGVEEVISPGPGPEDLETTGAVAGSLDVDEVVGEDGVIGGLERESLEGSVGACVELQTDETSI